MPPVISVVGISNSGKTTFLEKLLRELTSRSYKVATIKHTHHDQEFDQPQKDSWRHLKAGSGAVIFSAANGITLFRPLPEMLPADVLARFFGEEYDIVITEGFSRGNAPKIEVHRKEVGALLENASKRIAVVTDEPLEIKVRQFALDDAKGVADLIEEGFLKPRDELVSLYVDDKVIPLTAYPRQMMTRVMLAVASCLKGVGDMTNVQFFFRKKSGK